MDITFVALLYSIEEQCKRQSISTAAAAAAAVATAAAEVGAATDAVMSLALRRRHTLYRKI